MARLLLLQKLGSGDDAILTKWKAANAVIARRAERSRASVTAYHRPIHRVVCAIHL